MTSENIPAADEAKTLELLAVQANAQTLINEETEAFRIHEADGHVASFQKCRRCERDWNRSF